MYNKKNESDDITKYTPAQKAIREAILEVEKLETNELLTDISSLLEKAKYKMMEYIRNKKSYDLKKFRIGNDIIRHQNGTVLLGTVRAIFENSKGEVMLVIENAISTICVPVDGTELDVF